MFMGFFSLANLPTLLGLISALTACFLAGNGNVKFGIYMMFLAGICNVFNDKVARTYNKKTPNHTIFANELIDVFKIVSFGFAPCFIAFSFGFNGWFDTVVYSIYIACACVRIASQKTLENPTQKKKARRTRGIPLGTSLYVLTFLFLLTTFIPAIVTVWFSRIFFIVLAVGFVLNIRIKRPDFKRSIIMLGIELMVLLILLVAGNCKQPVREQSNTTSEDTSAVETSDVSK